MVRAAPDDLEEVIEMLSICIADMMTKGPSQWNADYPSRDVIAEDISSGTLYLARRARTLVGMIVLSEEQPPEYLEVNWRDREGRPLVMHRLAVHPKWQGTGIGRALFAFADSFAKGSGYTSIRGDTYSENSRMLGLVKASGYARTGDVRFRGLPRHFVCFEKAIR